MTDATAAPARLDARTMTDAEFREANNRRAWRDAIPKPAEQIAPDKSRAGPERETTPPSTTGGGVAPLPPSPPASKPPRDMTDAEFAEANARKAWRIGIPSR